MGTPDYLTCLLRNLYAGQEAIVITVHGTTEWFKIGNILLQRCILSPRLFNLSAEYIMRNARLDESQAGIKIAGKNTKNVRYADDITLKAEPDTEQWTGSKLGKRYIKAVYCHPAYLTSMQSTSCEMPGWMNHKLESRLLGETSTTSDMQMMPF